MWIYSISKLKCSNIDVSRTKNNYSLHKLREKSYETEFKRICKKQNAKVKIWSGEKASKFACEIVVPSPWKFREVPES